MVSFLTSISRKLTQEENMNNLKSVITISGLKQSWIANKIGEHPSRISDWIAERRIPSSPKKRMLCKILGCKVGDLFPKEKNG